MSNNNDNRKSNEDEFPSLPPLLMDSMSSFSLSNNNGSDSVFSYNTVTNSNNGTDDSNGLPFTDLLQPLPELPLDHNNSNTVTQPPPGMFAPNAFHHQQMMPQTEFSMPSSSSSGLMFVDEEDESCGKKNNRSSIQNTNNKRNETTTKKVVSPKQSRKPQREQRPPRRRNKPQQQQEQRKDDKSVHTKSGQRQQNTQKQHQQPQHQRQRQQQRSRHQQHHQQQRQKQKPKEKELSREERMEMMKQQQEKMIETLSVEPSTQLPHCPICFHDMLFSVVGECNHHVCHVCAVRWRSLHKDKSCMLCRTTLPKVVLTEEIEELKFEDVNWAKTKFNPKFQMHTTSKVAKEAGDSLFAITCPTCNERFSQKRLLRQHLKDEHGLQYCPICLRHGQKFQYEFMTFTRKELDRHMAEGDDDASGFKGHPNCLFCDQRFYDSDHLFRHMNDRHEKCRLCETQGKHNEFYSGREKLQEHYTKEHFPCPRCPLVAFEDKIGLIKHEKKEHSEMWKGNNIPLDFLDSSSNSSSSQRGRGHARQQKKNFKQRQQEEEEREMMRQFEQRQQEEEMMRQLPSASDFPTLSSQKPRNKPKTSSSSSSSSVPYSSNVRNTSKFSQKAQRGVQAKDFSATLDQTRRTKSTDNSNSSNSSGRKPKNSNRRTNSAESSSTSTATPSWAAKSTVSSTATTSKPRSSTGNKSRAALQQMAHGSYQYVKPSDFQARNKNLLTNIKAALGEDGLNDFKALSLAFKDKDIPAFQYTKRCEELFGSHFQALFSELVCLNPSLEAQNVLADAHNRLTSASKVINLSTKGSGRWGKQQQNQQRQQQQQQRRSAPVKKINWTRCKFCSQILAEKDVEEHEDTHPKELEEEFPTLGNVHPKAKTNSAFKKKGGRGRGQGKKSAWGSVM
eukprot:m.140150 g.140150  ORF g.140150 m.140150 type:complete len:900 (+) comp13177_c0_seq1:88-2787(+)